MKAIVTGGGGFAGSYLVKELLKENYQVLSLGNGSTPEGQKSIYQQADLSDPKAVASINFKEYDIVFHLAGLTNVGESFSKPSLYISVNSDIQINLFETAIKQKATPRFIIVGSGLIYDPKATLPLNETSPIVTNSPYAISKLCQEHLGHYYAARGIEVIIARAFNHVGPGQLPGFLVPDLAKRIVEAERTNAGYISVGNLEAKRDYSDVRDVVTAYRLLAEKGAPGEIYNVCSGIPKSGQEILDLLLQGSKEKLMIKQDPSLMRPSDTPIVYGSNEKLRQATGWQPLYDLKNTLADTLQYWRASTY